MKFAYFDRMPDPLYVTDRDIAELSGTPIAKVRRDLVAVMKRYGNTKVRRYIGVGYRVNADYALRYIAEMNKSRKDKQLSKGR
jgi:hypothetical protein